MLIIGVVWGVLERFAGFGLLGDAAIGVSNISPSLLLAIFLPMLIFESAFNLDWHQVRHVFRPALLLAFPGLVINAALAGAFIKAIEPNYTWSEALLVSTLLSATDPVAVSQSQLLRPLQFLGRPHPLHLPPTDAGCAATLFLLPTLCVRVFLWL